MSRGTQVRDTIELLCKIFRDNGMTEIGAETLRKAKFDQPEACAPLWRLLFELISFCCGVTDSSAAAAAFVSMTTEQQVMVVKKELQQRGYLSRSFASLPPSRGWGSRELLLALAWLINREAIITRFMDHRSSPVHDDVLSLYQTLQSEAEESWQRPQLGEKSVTAAQRVQQMLVLNHKLTMNLRLLHASQQQYSKLTHKIHSCTSGVSLCPEMNHLTTMQTYMLRHPQHMAKVLTLLEEDSTRLDNLLQWEDRSAIFWEWMESVLELKLQQMDGREAGASETDTAAEDGDGHAVPTIFLDVPPNIGAEIAACRRNLMNMILQYETAIERLEELWATKRKAVSDWELDGLLHSINAEISQLQQNLGHDPQCDPPPPPRNPDLCLTLVKNSTGHRAPAKVSNAVVAGSLSGNQSQQNTVSLQAEISRLQQEADTLQKELTEMRRDCLHKLNAIVAAAPATICIIPPRLRHLSQ